MGEPFPLHFSNGRSAGAIRVDRSSDLPDTLRRMGLCGPLPTLALVGGAGGMCESDFSRLSPLFMEALAPLAEARGAVVVDGGTEAGVMRLMGQARSETAATFPLVGVAVAAKVSGPGIPSSGPDVTHLEPNHTHFVLVPGSDWGDEVPWLAGVAGVLSKGAPSVTVLINGGEAARKDVAESTRLGRPVVVVAGTQAGRKN